MSLIKDLVDGAVIPPNVLESLVEDRVLLRVYYKAGSYMTYQADGEDGSLLVVTLD